MEKTSPLSHLHPYQWMDIIQYLSTDDFKSLRLAGNKTLTDPSMTNHLQLKMSEAEFFRADSTYSEEDIKRWLSNRNNLIIDDVNASICPNRVAYLATRGFLDSVTEIRIFDCSHHRATISQLATLPNLESLMLVDRGEALDELELILTHVGRLHTLKNLNIEFDCVINGSRLSFLSGLTKLECLRLRGFDFSEGMQYLQYLKFLESLHLCHGNYYSSPDDDVDEEGLMYLKGSTKLQCLHLEGFDCLTGVGFEPLCASRSLRRLVLKHCQELSEDVLSYIGRLTSLNSLHIVLSDCDDGPIFESDELQNLNSLSELKSLSLFYVLKNPVDLRALQGLTSLETLNIAVDEEIYEEDVDVICQSILPNFGSLKKIRIFSEDSMNHSFHRGNLEIEFMQFVFGDLVHLD